MDRRLDGVNRPEEIDMNILQKRWLEVVSFGIDFIVEERIPGVRSRIRTDDIDRAKFCLYGYEELENRIPIGDIGLVKQCASRQ
jgi:hypothetical protein